MSLRGRRATLHGLGAGLLRHGPGPPASVRYPTFIPLDVGEQRDRQRGADGTPLGPALGCGATCAPSHAKWPGGRGRVCNVSISGALIITPLPVRLLSYVQVHFVAEVMSAT